MKYFRLFLLFAIVAIFRVIGLVLNLFARRSSSKHLPDTLRLYRRTTDGVEYLWFYEIGEQLFVDAGNLGQPATRASFALEHWPAIAEHIRIMRDKGFSEIDPEGMQFLQITYKVRDDFAHGDEFNKRNALLDKLDEHFALTGQGYWVDASSGSGTMELGYDVVDFEIAAASVRKLLAGTEYGDYLDISSTPITFGNMDQAMEFSPA